MHCIYDHSAYKNKLYEEKKGEVNCRNAMKKEIATYEQLNKEAEVVTYKWTKGDE